MKKYQMFRIHDFLKGLIDLFFTLAEIVLGLRIIFLLFAADSNVAFVRWIYSTSDSLLAPFRGIFPAGHLGNGHVLDFSALFGMLIYGLFAMVLIAAVDLLTPKHTVKK